MTQPLHVLKNHKAVFCMRPIKKQQGVAVITALLLTTLAITIVASLF